jgi:hypothetical protein
VVTWGNPEYGGDSSAVQVELKQGVDTIYSNRYAFAALMQDRSVVTWGDADWGGDSSQVQAELKQWMNERVNVQSFLDYFYTHDLVSLAGEYYPKIQVYSAKQTFFALLPNRTLLQWGKLF